jgi:hypothetical protein
MHWDYKLNHPTHVVMTKLAKQKMLPQRITKILKSTDKHNIKPTMCNDIKQAMKPGEVVSVDLRIYWTDEWKPSQTEDSGKHYTCGPCLRPRVYLPSYFYDIRGNSQE